MCHNLSDHFFLKFTIQISSGIFNNAIWYFNLFINKFLYSFNNIFSYKAICIRFITNNCICCSVINFYRFHTFHIFQIIQQNICLLTGHLFLLKYMKTHSSFYLMFYLKLQNVHLFIYLFVCLSHQLLKKETASILQSLYLTLHPNC